MKTTFEIYIAVTSLCIGIITGVILLNYKIPHSLKRKLLYTFKNIMGFKELDYSIPVNLSKIEIFGEPIEVFDPRTDYIGTTLPEKSFMNNKEFISYRYFWHFKEISDYLVSDEAKQTAKRLHKDFWAIEGEGISNYLEAMESKRRFLKKVLGINDLPHNGKVRELSVVVDSDSMVIERVKLESRIPSISVPLYIARPKGIELKGVVIAIHGVASVPEKVIGIEARDYTRQFGLELVKQGYIVYAPYIINIQNRTPNISGLGMMYTGNTNWSIDIQKLLSVVDNIKNEPTLSALPLAAYGISAGGHFASMLAAIDKRIDITISSGALFVTALASDYAIENDINIVNYFLFRNVDQEVLFKFSDYARLIYPRPLIIEMGALDNAAGDIELWPEIQGVYKKYEKEKNLKLVWFKGYHETVPKLVLPILDEFVNELKMQGD